jgi:hypothetical protein
MQPCIRLKEQQLQHGVPLDLFPTHRLVPGRQSAQLDIDVLPWTSPLDPFLPGERLLRHRRVSLFWCICVAIAIVVRKGFFGARDADLTSFSNNGNGDPVALDRHVVRRAIL